MDIFSSYLFHKSKTATRLITLRNTYVVNVNKGDREAIVVIGMFISPTFSWLCSAYKLSKPT